MIIYPPIMVETIPAFISDVIIIPFFQNLAVSIGEVKKFYLKIQNYTDLSDNTLVLNIPTGQPYLTYDEKTRAGKLIFNTMNAKDFFKANNYYKFQLAYSDIEDSDTTEEIEDNVNLVYSTVSIGKCIGNAPNIEIENYIATCSFDLLSEPIYSYRFVLMDNNQIIIQDTGEILHNVDEDTIKDGKRTTTHVFYPQYELETGIYTLKYYITTVNGYNSYMASELEITTSGNAPTNEFRAYNNIDNGYVGLILKSNEDNNTINYIIERKSDKENWVKIKEFSYTNPNSSQELELIDMTIEQGIEYIYALRTKDSTENYSARQIIDPIKVDFEDIFLTDGKRQLKIKYNPKVSSFKDTISEQKTETIGSKYPFFFRNNMVKYKEIPISGLISYQMDDNEMFMELNCVKSIQLTSDNIAAERKFKLEVLEWLNNGELKLFRSPTEGNYVIRLMNVSLSPNDTLGRMLHTFSATGYEAADSDTSSLVKLGLIKLGGE